MDLAIKEIKERIDCYDFWVRDCSPYFKESKEKYEKRLNELKDTLEQLKRVLEIISHESSGLNIADVNASALIKFGSYLTGHDESTIEQMLNDYNQHLR